MVIALGIYLLCRSKQLMEIYRNGLDAYLARYPKDGYGDAMRYVSHDVDENHDIAVGMTICAIPVLFIGVAIALAGISPLINPNFTAIRILMEMIR
jgi:hypothetical protein